MLAATSASALVLPREGWVTWSISTVDSAPNWCCFDQVDGAGATLGSCDLDSRHQSYGSRDRDQKVSTMRIYARHEGGKLAQLRSFGPNCAVSSKAKIEDLGPQPVAESLDWLRTHLLPGEKLVSDVLAAIAVHQGQAAEDLLVDLARRDSRRETRKDALFWLAQVRGEAGAARVRPFLFDAPDAQVREHAAFAYAQSVAADRAAALIEQATADLASKVRSQAWFWLAQIAAPQTEAAIGQALAVEVKESVRHQAIFALSQLPRARAAAALIAVVEDRRLSMADRKQALFWLGQTESDEAIAYLDAVLK